MALGRSAIAGQEQPPSQADCLSRWGRVATRFRGANFQGP